MQTNYYFCFQHVYRGDKAVSTIQKLLDFDLDILWDKCTVISLGVSWNPLPLLQHFWVG